VRQALEVCSVTAIEEGLRASVPALEVVALCGCGCDTVEFSRCNWAEPPQLIADGIGVTPSGASVGVLVFAGASGIACLEVYNLFEEAPARLPVASTITPNTLYETAAV